MTGPGEFAAVFAALIAAHHVGDYWVQTHTQACDKGKPGWAGRWACLAHVITYHLTCAAALTAVVLTTGLHLNPVPVAAGLLLSAVTHYIAYRREPLRRLAALAGKGEFWQVGATEGKPNCLGSGACALDQSWHIGWLFATALIITI